MRSDVVIEGDTVILEFEGKGGKPIRKIVSDKLLARVAKTLFALKGRRLFSVPDDSGRPRPITARQGLSCISGVRSGSGLFDRK